MRFRIRRLHRVIAAVLAAVTAVVTFTLTTESGPDTASAAVARSVVTLHVVDAPVRDVLLRLGKISGANVVIASSVRGKVSVSLSDVGLDQALEAILAPLGYTYHRYGAIIYVGTFAQRSAAPAPQATAAATAVVSLSVISVDRAAAVLRSLYSRTRITVDRPANALIVVGSAEDISSIRSVAQAIDVPNPTKATTEAIQLRTLDPKSVIGKIGALYPSARVTAGPNRTILVEAVPQDMAQIRALVAAIDTPQSTPAPPSTQTAAVRLALARPQDVVRALAHEYPSIRATAAGSSVVVSGSPDDVEKAKALITLIDQPPANALFTQVYRLHSVDARSVGDLIARSFRTATVTADEDLNAITVTATSAVQQHIADALAQLDVTPNLGGAAGVAQPGTSASAGVGPGGNNVEVITLKAAVPGQNQGPSTSATDVATAVTQALQQSAPDLRITVPNNSTQLVLTGSPYSIRLAKQLIDQLDVTPPLVVLDTEVLELDETAAKNLGLTYSQPLIQTTYSELTPVAPPSGGTPPPLLGIQPFTRTPVSITVALQALVTNGTARVLADPRITTISGHQATIRAGDQINYTTAIIGSGVGSVVSQQVQSVQTGVTLDITPVVNAGNTISVTLHPTVNSLLGFSQGIPQIANRETQTTVTLADNQTLIIGGLIQENSSRTENKLPFLGDIPLIGRLLFRNTVTNYIRNELVIVVTPHIVLPGIAAPLPGPTLPVTPKAEALPTLPPETKLPTPYGEVTQPATPTPQPRALRGTEPAPSPQPAVTNEVFVYGSPTSATYAGPNDPIKILYVAFTPTALRNGDPVTIVAITTTNVAKMTLAYGGVTTQFAPSAPGRFHWTFNFNAGTNPIARTQGILTLSAFRADGASVVLPIPVILGP